MDEVFVKVLNMSIAASWLILAVLLLRLVLKRAPKWAIVLLWGIAGLRLAVPFSFESAWSLVPSAGTFSTYNIQFETPAVSSGIPAVNNAVNPILGEVFAPAPGASVNPLYVWMSVASAVWLLGMAAMLLYAVISYARVRRSVAERVPYARNVFLCDHVRSPFILGLFAPKIYLPSHLDAPALGPVIAHEKAHLARRDHWWKPLGFLILTVHWFNPLCWIAYVLLCRDIEQACDEKVIRQLDLNGKKQYSAALLACSTGRRPVLVAVCPLAFGETGVKERVRNVLHYKKPAFWLVSAAVIACAAAAVCFLTDPVAAESGTPGTTASGTTAPGAAASGTTASGTAAPGAAAPDAAAPDAAAPNPAGGGEPAAWGPTAQEPAAWEPDFSTLSAEQTAIRRVIAEHNRPANPAGLVSCVSFTELAVLSGTPLAESSVHKVTYYGWALYEAYRVTDSGLETVSSRHIPVALSFDADENGYTLTEYWEPRDGSFYAQDVREKFPANVAEDGSDSRKFILAQKQECYAQAAAVARLDIDRVIGRLLETVCSSPALSSDPEDYINEHAGAYRELTYYGRYTLQYCFARFERGGETGLEGRIMMRACGDIAAGWGEEPLEFFLPMNGVLTGQMWYDAFKSNALELMEQFAEIELAGRYPASYLLLSMLGEF